METLKLTKVFIDPAASGQRALPSRWPGYPARRRGMLKIHDDTFITEERPGPCAEDAQFPSK